MSLVSDFGVREFGKKLKFGCFKNQLLTAGVVFLPVISLLQAKENRRRLNELSQELKKENKALVKKAEKEEFKRQLDCLNKSIAELIQKLGGR
jgi:septal ring factor EnvC (AmiA/AmiB activator)